ncbi:MAG: CPBP family intramembrane metalloprotease [Bacilli bacterium]|nr:CPBP family intramembrane metalloprotease [Bacilli bacterium]
MKENKWIKALLWLLLICFYIFINIMFGSIIKSLNIKNHLLLNTVYIISEIIITGILVYLYRNDFKGKFKELNSKEGNKKITSSIKIWLLGLLGMVIFNIFLSTIIKDIAENESLNRDTLKDLSFYAYTTMIILTPICEEIIFRLSPSKMFNNKYIYIIFSGLMFGFAHVFLSSGIQMLYILPYTSLGIAFSSIYANKQNILCSILMHSLHNLICILIIVLI